MKNIGIIGTRRRNTNEDFKMLWNKFKQFYDKGDRIVSGGCPKGGDAFAERIMDKISLGINERIIHYPKPDHTKKDSFRIACFERNTLIAKDSDILLAIVASDRTGGTEDTIRKFHKYHPEGKVIII